MKTILSTIIRTVWPAAGRWSIATGFLLSPLLTLAQTDKQVWVQRFGTTFGSSELARSIARDSAGNAAVAGDTDEGGLGSGILLIKYSGAGEGLWTNRFNTSEEDRAVAVAMDGSGNVFVTGSSGNGTSGYRYLTLAFSSLGIPLWTNLFNGPGGPGYTEGASALAVDNSGNVFVTGESHVNGRFAFATLKYSSAGAPLWTNMFVAIGDREEGASALAVDNAGNVIVTGGVHGTGNWNDYDYITIKYASDGVPLWTNRCSGPGLTRDIPNSLAVDGSGNVVVTGDSGLTVKYSSGGAALWTNVYPGLAWDLAVDPDGNVAVTGNNSYTITTIKYSAAGELVWTRWYEAGLNYFPRSAVAADSNGNFLVTGYAGGGADQVTIKYSAAGSVLWTGHSYTELENESYRPLPALVIDPDGNALVTGYFFNGYTTDFATRKYGSNGDVVWANVYDGTVSVSDSPNAVAVDSSGNIIVTGGGTDYATIKYSPSGVPLWTNYYDGPAHWYDAASAVAVASNGNIFVTGGVSHGDFEDSTSYFLTIAYTGEGVPLWANACPRGGTPVGVVLDGNGNVIVAGTEASALGDGGWVTVKYTGAGVPVWTNGHYGAVLDDYGTVTGLAVDHHGDVVVVGSSDPYFAAIKYSSSGSALWTNRFNPAGRSANAWAVAIGTNGDIFVTGAARYTATDYDSVTIKYSSAGVPLWTNRYGSAAMFDVTTALALDGSGNVLVTGYSRATNLYYGSTNGLEDFITIKYSNDGTALWTNRYGASDKRDIPYSMAVDRNSNVFVTGQSSDWSISDSVTVAYSSGGLPLWTNRYYGPAGHMDAASHLAVTDVGEVVVVNYSSGDYATVKYDSGFALDITSPPQDQIRNAGATATFSVGVSGTAPFTFQWRCNGTNLVNDGNVSGVTTSNLTVTSVTTNDAGNYTVVVSNPAGSVTSIVAAMSVILPDTPPRLSVNSMVAGGNDFVLAWPTNTDGFTLQSATNLTPPVMWNVVTNLPVVLDGRYTVTNSRSGSQKFFRMHKP